VRCSPWGLAAFRLFIFCTGTVIAMKFEQGIDATPGLRPSAAIEAERIAARRWREAPPGRLCKLRGRMAGDLSVATGAWLSLDHQHIDGPAHNADRGPVRRIAARPHWQYRWGILGSR